MVCLQIILPQIEPLNITPPARCPIETCPGTTFRLHQKVVKPIRDHAYPQVIAHRYRCLTCGHTFRLYPGGVTHQPTTQRIRDLAVLLYRLGLSYGAVAELLETWKIYMCKSQVYKAVQSTSILNKRRDALIQDLRILPFGNQPPLVRCHNVWLPIELITNERHQMIVNFTIPDQAHAFKCQETIHSIVAMSSATTRLLAKAAA